MGQRKQLNLFSHGQHSTLTSSQRPSTGLYLSRKEKANYRKSYNEAECCEHCAHLRKNRLGGRTFYKCELIGITNGKETDIQLSGVCNRFVDNHQKCI